MMSNGLGSIEETLELFSYQLKCSLTVPLFMATLIHQYCNFGSELEFLHFWTIHVIGWCVIWLTSRARQLSGQMETFGQQM